MSALVQPDERTILDRSELFRQIQQLVGAFKGQSEWGVPIDLISYDSDSRYAVVIRNLGTGGGLQVVTSGGVNALLVSDGGVNVTGLTTSGALAVGTNLTVGGTAAVTGSITGSSTVQGTRLISTIATGTAPLTVTSTTKVTNLNADTVDGLDSTAFVLRAGDTMTGQLLIQTNQGLKLQNSVSAGVISFNATNVADPALEIKDQSGDNIVTMYPTGSTYALDVNLGTGSTNAARFTGPILVVGSITASGAGVTATTGTFSGAVSGTTGTFSGALSGTTGTFSGGVSAGASSAFTGGISVVSGGAAITGNSTVTGTLGVSSFFAANGKTATTAPDYTVTNLIVNRSIDPSTINHATLAYVVATMVDDLINLTGVFR